MESMDNVAAVLHEVDSTEVEELLGMTQGALMQVRDIQERLGVTLDGSSHESAASLQARFVTIQSYLGAIVTEIAGVRHDRDALLAHWGIGNAPVEQGLQELPPQDESNRGSSTGIFLKSLVRPETQPSRIARSAVNTLTYAHLFTVEDLLLAGKWNIYMTRNMGVRKMAWVEEMLAEQAPATPLPDNPDPKLAAQLRPTLHQVPAVVLAPSNPAMRKIYDLFYPSVTVHQLLHDKLLEPMLATGVGLSPGDSKKVLQDAYAMLLEEARIYAAGFEQAKREMSENRSIPELSFDPTINTGWGA